MARVADSGHRLVSRARTTGTRVRRARAGGAASLAPSRIRTLLTGAASAAATVAQGAKAAVTTTLAAAPKAAGLAARFGPGIAGFLAPVLVPLAIGSFVEGRRRGKATRETLARLSTPEGHAANVQRKMFLQTLQENLLSSKLRRMQRVARNDPAIFKMLAAMVVGSARPRTNSRTVRIGRDPSQAEMISSGLFG